MLRSDLEELDEYLPVKHRVLRYSEKLEKPGCEGSLLDRSIKLAIANEWFRKHQGDPTNNYVCGDDGVAFAVLMEDCWVVMNPLPEHVLQNAIRIQCRVEKKLEPCVAQTIILRRVAALVKLNESLIGMSILC